LVVFAKKLLQRKHSPELRKALGQKVDEKMSRNCDTGGIFLFFGQSA